MPDIGERAPRFLQPTQIEAHISRLTAIRTQLVGFPEDGRAVDCIPGIDSIIATLKQEKFVTVPPPNPEDAEAEGDIEDSGEVPSEAPEE